MIENKFAARGLGAILISGAMPSAISAATLKSVATKDSKTIILLSGEIIEGDADTLKAAIKTANDAGKLVSGVRLNSPGGNLLESLKLADAVRFARVATNVAGNATCASACFLVYAAGATKFANYTAQLGVHGAADKQGEETVASGAATVSMARAAKDLGVPAAIIGRIVVTPPNEMVWITPQDLQSMGTTMIGKPSQTPISQTAMATADPSIVPKQTQPGDPTQLEPQTKSAAPSWSKFLDKVIKRSAAQNNGKPNYTRGCQPEFKTCYDAITVIDTDGKLSSVNVRLSIGKSARLMLPSIACYDWDEWTTHRDMKDSNGNWYKVADE